MQIKMSLTNRSSGLCRHATTPVTLQHSVCSDLKASLASVSSHQPQREHRPLLESVSGFIEILDKCLFIAGMVTFSGSSGFPRQLGFPPPPKTCSSGS